MKTSQQNASYFMSRVKKESIQSYSAIIDPAKLGYTMIQVYYRRIDLRSDTKTEIIHYLQAQDSVAEIEFFEEGFDFKASFCVPNLSSFNKMNRAFIHTFRGKIEAAKIYPIIVRHIYPKKYLLPKSMASELVICGDRDEIKLSPEEKKVLNFFFDKPLGTLIEGAQQFSLHPRSIAKIKNHLEKQKIIRSYVPNWDFNKLGISRKRIMVKSEGFSEDEERKLLTFALFHPCIIELSKQIGDYDVLIEVEGEDLMKRDVLKDLRIEFPLSDFLTMRGIETVKKDFISSRAMKQERNKGERTGEK